jgi:hypothetical protein
MSRPRVDLTPELVSALESELAQVNYERAQHYLRTGQYLRPLTLPEYTRQSLGEVVRLNALARLMQPLAVADDSFACSGGAVAFGGEGIPR